MRRLMRLAARLYPAAWRVRYGAEFEALLEDMEPRWRDVWNVVGGATNMQMTTWTGWKMVAALGAAGAIAMAVAAAVMQPVYQSSAVMRVQELATAPGQSLGQERAKRIVAMVVNAQGYTSLEEIVQDERLYPRGVGKGTMDDAVAQLRRDIRFMPADHASALEVSFRYPDAIKAQQVTRKLMALMMRDGIPDAPEGQTPPLAEVLDPPSLPLKPIYPNWPIMIVVGLGAGALLGCLYSARKGWRVVLCSAVVGATLAVGLAVAVWGRVILHTHALPVLAAGGLLLGLTVASVAVMLRRRPLAG